jgi:hypothetical protein
MNTVLAAHPEVAAKVATAVDAVVVDASKVAEDKAQDDARANALARTLEATIGHIAPTKQATPVDPDTATKSPSA